MTLIAGLFKLEPWQLVRDTDYPSARAERLPPVVTRYTQAELVSAIVDALIESLPDPDIRTARLVLEPWRARLVVELEASIDDGERALLIGALRSIDALIFK